MGQTTPNISIYVPSTNETGYDASFLAGMNNLDQHDHSGAPTKGVPLSSGGIQDGSITRSKLAANVLTTGGGLDFDSNNAIEIAANGVKAANLNSDVLTSGGGLAFDSNNAIETTGVLNSIYGLTGTGLLAVSATNTASLYPYASSTWSPVLSFGGVVSGFTYTKNAGKYWRIGPIVYFVINIEISGSNSQSGDATVDIPIASANDGHDAICTMSADNIVTTNSGGATEFYGKIAAGASVVNLMSTGNNQTGSSLSSSKFAQSSMAFSLTGFYWTS